MALVRTNSLLAVLYVTVLVLCHFERGEVCMSWPFCSGFIHNGADSSDPDGELKTICSSEYQAEYSCKFRDLTFYLCPKATRTRSWPEGLDTTMHSLESIPGFYSLVFMEEGGFDGYCTMMYSPCSDVMRCSETPTGSPEGGASPINYYMMFNKEALRRCRANSKETMTCKLKALEKCPDRVLNKTETIFKKAIDMSVPVTYGLVSYKDELRFLQETCHKLPKYFADDPCTMGVYVSQNFKMCNEKVIIEYSKQKSCAVHDLSKQCIIEYVQPECGKDVAMILAQNTFMIFPGIPSDCEDRISGSDENKTSSGMSDGDVKTTPFGISDNDVNKFPFGMSDSDVMRASFGLLLISFAFIYIL